MYLCSAFLFGFATLQPVSAQEKRVKWEYGELAVSRTFPARPAGKDADGNDVPAVPAKTIIRWTTGAGDVSVNGWEELAEKLKAPVKKEDSVSFQKIKVLNVLGTDGWELVEQQTSTQTAPAARGGLGGPSGLAGPGGPSPMPPTTMLFKRRMP